MKLYNSLTRRKENLIPLQDKKVHFYSCGQTIYLDLHLGNARTYSYWDILVRYLRWRGFDVFWVQNIRSLPHFGDIKKIQDPFVVDLILRCLCYDPEKRITAEEALQHIFFDDIRKEKDFEDPHSMFFSSFVNEWNLDQIRYNLIKMLNE